MKDIQCNEKNLYYTSSHEWIRFMEKEAYIGVSHFRIAGTKKVKEIAFVKVYGFKKKGEIFASIQIDFQQIDVRMPVNGTITKINNVNHLLNENILLTHPEMEGWLAKISIHQPAEKDGLLSPEQYTRQ
jgi:glycine cleavage system H lipoate-binding protein